MLVRPLAFKSGDLRLQAGDFLFGRLPAAQRLLPALLRCLSALFRFLECQQVIPRLGILEAQQMRTPLALVHPDVQVQESGSRPTSWCATAGASRSATSGSCAHSTSHGRLCRHRLQNLCWSPSGRGFRSLGPPTFSYSRCGTNAPAPSARPKRSAEDGPSANWTARSTPSSTSEPRYRGTRPPCSPTEGRIPVTPSFQRRRSRIRSFSNSST